MRLDSKSNSGILGASTRNKRKLMVKGESENYYDFVKHIAVEGSLLTFIGKVTYQADSDTFSFKDGLGFVGGGAQDALLLLKTRFKDLLLKSEIALGLGICCFGIAAGLVWYRKTQQANQEIAKKLHAEMLERIEFNQDATKLGKCTSECVICASAAATVVLVPCNHLTLCETCYNTMSKSPSSLKCPLCRKLATFKANFLF